MFIRMAAGTMTGLALATGAAVTLTIGAGVVGAALLARRLCEERRGWKEDAADVPSPETPLMGEPGLDAPAA